MRRVHSDQEMFEDVTKIQANLMTAIEQRGTISLPVPTEPPELQKPLRALQALYGAPRSLGLNANSDPCLIRIPLKPLSTSLRTCFM